MWLSGVVGSFEMVETVLERVGGVAMWRSSIWRSTQESGAKFQVLEQQQQEQANRIPDAWEAAPAAKQRGQRMGVAMDGAMMNVRKEGWKELKISSLFEIGTSTEQDKVSGERVDLAHAVNLSYVAHLGGPERLGDLTWAEAQRRGWEQAWDTQVLGDGAVWIWNQAALHFPDSHQTVDWYHAKDHLTEAARLYKGDASPSFQRWLNSRETLLYQGHAQRIAIELEKAAKQPSSHSDALAREAAYFRHNQARMNYLEMREGLWPIGSGMIESGAKQFKIRFCGPGMRWSRKGAENLLPIRSAILNHRFDLLWSAAQNLPPV